MGTYKFVPNLIHVILGRFAKCNKSIEVRKCPLRIVMRVEIWTNPRHTQRKEVILVMFSSYVDYRNIILEYDDPMVIRAIIEH